MTPNNVQEIFIDRIDDPEHAMRSTVRDESLYELADNIKANGLISPITVRPKNGRYEVVAGHRRFSACAMNKMLKIPCVVRELDDREAFAVMAAENLERKDVDVIDEAKFIRDYMEQTGTDVKETAAALRRSEKYVKDRISVGEMPEYMRQYLKEGRLRLGAALALNQISNDRLKESWTHYGVAQSITQAQAEYQLQDYRNNKAMYDGVAQQSDDAATRIEPKPIMFRCAVDGREYDARLCKSVFIYEENLPYLESLRAELNAGPAQTPNPAGVE